MREIKFRAWDKETVQMLYPSKDMQLIEIDYHVLTLGVANVAGCSTNESDYVLMQYTGLKDKNGKEIYEGDIVNYGGVKFVYEWNCNGLWMCKRASDNFKVTIDYWDCEVIGNIYENEEIIKQIEGEA